MTQNKEFYCNCVNSLFSIPQMEQIKEKSIEISKNEFLSSCVIDDELLSKINEYPNDYQFFKSDKVYFFKWSEIEYFFL